VSAEDDRPEPTTPARVVTDRGTESVAKVSHDIRASLNTVLGMVDLLDATGLSPDQARLVRTLERAGNRLLSLVEQVFGGSGAVAALPSGSTQPGPLASLDGLRVLQVDDSAESAELVRAYLQPMGAIVEVVETAESALDARRGHAFDVVLMDLNLPGMDGFEATRRLRRAEQECHQRPVPIIGLSADSRADRRERALASGFTEYLTKPVRGDVLASMLHRYHPSRTSHLGAADPRSPAVVALLPKFVGHRERDIVVVREAIVRLDFAAIATVGHNLRGSAVSYGFPELSALGESLERAAGARDVRRVAEIVGQLEACVRRIRIDVGESANVARPPASGTRIRAHARSEPVERKGRGKP